MASKLVLERSDDHHQSEEEMRVWDCGSPLYDSYELASLTHLIERHLMTHPSLGGSKRFKSHHHHHHHHQMTMMMMMNHHHATSTAVISSMASMKAATSKKGHHHHHHHQGGCLVLGRLSECMGKRMRSIKRVKANKFRPNAAIKWFM